jgi:hypothetical protein
MQMYSKMHRNVSKTGTNFNATQEISLQKTNIMKHRSPIIIKRK